MKNLELINAALPNRRNAIYQVIRNGEVQTPDPDCSHDWEQFTQEKKWGNIEWGMCLICGGTMSGNKEIISDNILRQQRRIDYETSHAGHPRGAKVETGPPTMGGRDYED